MTATAKIAAPLPNGLRLVEGKTDDDEPNAGTKKKQRDQLLEAVLGAGVTFWRDADGTA